MASYMEDHIINVVSELTTMLVELDKPNYDSFFIFSVSVHFFLVGLLDGLRVCSLYRRHLCLNHYLQKTLLLCCSQSLAMVFYTVDSLLRAAGTSRSIDKRFRPKHTDHVVELQLVVAALNSLSDRAYWAEGWEFRLVDFFNKERNLQSLTEQQNRKKGVAVRQVISQLKTQNGIRLTGAQRGWIQEIQDHWDDIKHYLHGFQKFKDALDDILAAGALRRPRN